MSSLLSSFCTALENRLPLLTQLQQDGTTCYRLFHGATEGQPGLSIDRYGPLLLFQSWRERYESSLIQQLTAHTNDVLQLQLQAACNHRAIRAAVDHQLSHSLIQPRGLELHLSYDVRTQHLGIDPLLFLDFRAGRRMIAAHSKGKTVLNLFAYTCGIGLVAAKAGCKRVVNVDFSHQALTIGQENAQFNDIDKDCFQTLREDVIPVIRQFAGLGIKGRARKRSYTRLAKQQFDIVVLDPPRRAKSPFGMVDVVNDYQSLFKPALLATKPNGNLLVTNNVASVSWKDWSHILHRCAEKIGCTIHLTQITPEADFPSPDQRWPLKMAWVDVTN